MFFILYSSRAELRKRRVWIPYQGRTVSALGLKIWDLADPRIHYILHRKPRLKKGLLAVNPERNWPQPKK